MSKKTNPCAWCQGKYLDKAHVPTKFLIPKSKRNIPQWPTLPACLNCNQKLKLDEEWFVVNIATMLSDYSPNAKEAFDLNVSNHLRHSPSIANKYIKGLKLVNLKIGDKDYGIKTEIKFTDEDWNRINHVIEMYARGLFFIHSNNHSAVKLKAKISYINSDRFKNYLPIIQKLNKVNLFPDVFQYAFVIRKNYDGGIFYFQIYQKPAFIVVLATSKKNKEYEEKVKKGEIIVDNTPFIEILG